MSYLSHALQRSLEDYDWSLVHLAKLAGIHPSSLSMYVSGARPIGPRILQQLLPVMPDDRRPALIRAWLLDQLPRDEYRSLVDITPQVGIVSATATAPHLDLSEYPDDLRQALDLLARKTAENEPLKKLLLNLADMLRTP
jgi:transcriptional regulator with XRE-family HTH domain